MQTVSFSPDTDEKIIKNCINILERYSGIEGDRLCVFDIETTGLSPKVSSVYLIGAAHIKNNRLQLTQFFADDYTSEEKLLKAFSEYLEDFDAVIHFNGTTFDIPYLQEKCAVYGLPSPFIRPKSIDIYKIVSKKRYIFPTLNCKLTSIEKFMGFERGVDSDGGECIGIYTDYMKHKFAKETSAENECFQTLIKHNRDDLEGTIIAAQVIAYVEHIFGKVSFLERDGEIIITDELFDGIYYPTGLMYNFVLEKSRRQKNIKTHRRIITPAEIDKMRGGDITGSALAEVNIMQGEDITDSDKEKNNNAIFSFYDNKLVINIPIEHSEKYHFYPDYKNYFYLPDEDMAVHKSVGIYVDSEHRKKATPADCYIKKTGAFILLPVREMEHFTAFTNKNKQYLFIDKTEIKEDNLEHIIAAYLGDC